MNNIKYIDNSYFHKICLKSESVIIFKKPSGFSEETCSEISERIEKLTEKDEASISLSVVHEETKVFESYETIEKSMAICKGNGDILFSAEIVWNGKRWTEKK